MPNGQEACTHDWRCANTVNVPAQEGLMKGLVMANVGVTDEHLRLIRAGTEAVSACYKSLGLSWADALAMQADLAERVRDREKLIEKLMQQAGITPGPAEGRRGQDS